MPPSKQASPATKSSSLQHAPKKKHSPPPPPPPHHDDEKPHKPGKKHHKRGEDKPAGKHLRRAFEHLGRVQALQAQTEVEDVTALVQLAQTSMDRGNAHAAADLLRAAEHLGFAALAAQSDASANITPDLEEALRREFRKLLERAEEHHLAKDGTLDKLLRQTVDHARSAFDAEAFHHALELARAAESLASIDDVDQPQPNKALPAVKKKALKA